MNNELNSNLIAILNECTAYIENKEYEQWYNSSSARSFEDYRSKYIQETLDRIEQAIEDLTQN